MQQHRRLCLYIYICIYFYNPLPIKPNRPIAAFRTINSAPFQRILKYSAHKVYCIADRYFLLHPRRRKKFNFIAAIFRLLPLVLLQRQSRNGREKKQSIYNFLRSLTWVELSCYPKFKYPSAVYANFQVDSAQFGVQTLNYCFEIITFFLVLFFVRILPFFFSVCLIYHAKRRRKFR